MKKPPATLVVKRFGTLFFCEPCGSELGMIPQSLTRSYEGACSYFLALCRIARQIHRIHIMARVSLVEALFRSKRSGLGDLLALLVGIDAADLDHGRVARLARLATEVAVANLLVFATTLATDRKFSVRIEQEDLLATVRATSRLPTIEVLVGQLLAELVELPLFFGGGTCGCNPFVDLVALGLCRCDLFRVVCEPIPDRDHMATLGDLDRGDAAQIRRSAVVREDWLLEVAVTDRPGEVQLRPEDADTDLLRVHVVPF